MRDMKSIKWEDRQSQIELLSHKDKVRFALFCAKQVEQTVPEAIDCIRVVERWLDGKASADECRRVADAVANANAAAAAYCAATNAVAYAAYAANVAAIVANARTAYANAAHIANTKQAQMEYLYELVHINEIIENVLLCNQHL